jgi:hypothetical protein
MGPRVEEARAVGAGLDAITATDAIVLVDQNHPVLALEGGSHGADLDAGRVFAVVAQLGDEKCPEDLFVIIHGRKTVDAAVGAVDAHLSVCIDDVTLHPGSEVVGFLRYIVFNLASLDALSAADALVDLDPHRIVVFRRVVVIATVLGEHFYRSGHSEEKSRAGDFEKFRQKFSSLIGLRHLASLRGVLVMALPTH